MKRILCVFSLIGFLVIAFAAQAGDQPDAVTIKGGKPFAMRGDKLNELADNVNFSSDVVVTTNGTFTVADGKDRKLDEGQIIRSDGWLVNPDGSVEPVLDHVAMKNGKVLVVRDGQAQPLTKSMKFPNGMSLAPDSSCIYPDGSRTRLMDGQLFRLDGTPIASKDTVSLKKGVVVVQRDGTLISLKPVQIMGMNDGTRVYGDGRIEKQNGTTAQLREGQTILLDGALVRR
jgi:hypothetical protein